MHKRNMHKVRLCCVIGKNQQNTMRFELLIITLSIWGKIILKDNYATCCKYTVNNKGLKKSNLVRRR